MKNILTRLKVSMTSLVLNAGIAFFDVTLQIHQSLLDVIFSNKTDSESYRSRYDRKQLNNLLRCKHHIECFLGCTWIY